VVLQVFDLCLRLAASADVGLHADKVSQRAVVVPHGRDRQLVPERRSVPAVVEQRDLDRPPLLQRLPDRGQRIGIGVIRLEDARVLAQHLV
jgi:hypothetical protein